MAKSALIILMIHFENINHKLCLIFIYAYIHLEIEKIIIDEN